MLSFSPQPTTMCSRAFSRIIVLIVVADFGLNFTMSRNLQAWLTPNVDTSSNVAHTTTSFSLTSNAIEERSWHQEEVWTKHCFVVEDICHRDGSLFYRNNSDRHQPAFVFQQHTNELKDDWMVNNGLPDTFNVTSLPTKETSDCIDSSLSTHVILTSDYSDMLGEFYMRVLVHFYELTRHLDLDAFRRDSQLYLHVQSYRNISLLESHRLFTLPWRNRPLIHFISLLRSSRCQCLPRAVFCGYKVEERATGLHLRPTGTVIQPPYDVVPSSALSELRSLLRQHVIDERPSMRADIERYRTNVLGANHTEAKLVGLLQREGRRRWLNLEEVKKSILKRFVGERIVAVEVNFDTTDALGRDQVVQMGALDALIGIHGAGLTHATWMKPGSLVVELLPFLPKNITYGDWTRTIDGPTPLGVIFHQTDLTHVGYRLPRTSAPYCNDTVDLECWRKNNWEVRDFVAASSTVTELIELFLSQRPSTCPDYQAAGGSKFVVYNVNCSVGDDELAAPHHYYHNETNS